MNYKIVDFISKKPVAAQGFVFAGDKPWEIQMDLEKIREHLNLDYFKIAAPGLSKYLPLMPLKFANQFVSLKELATPLVRSKTLAKQLGIDLHFKVEGKNPTGSFKDRGSAVEISIAKELGAKAIILASTGNMAASCACYAAAAHIPCFILVPEGVPMGKLAQVIAFGGHIVQIKGSYNDAARLAEQLARKMNFYLAGDYAYRLEGQKTAAFEMIDQFLFQVPDVVIVPIGCGTNIAAYAKGFDEYYKLGLINQVPQLIGVEAVGAAAVVNSFNQQQDTITPLAGADTIASAIAVPDPIDGVKALQAIYSTAGRAIAVSDEDILAAQYMLSTQEGLFVESASAATVAAILKLSKEYVNKKVVCILTGDGLKDAGVVLKAAIKPPTIYPEENEFMQLYRNQFFNTKNMIFSNRNQILFDKNPTVAEISEQLKTLFAAHYDEDYVLRIKAILDRILQKGKVITVSDFQDSVQDALETLRHPKSKIFSVLDFEVTTGKDRVSHAKVKVRLAEEESAAAADGTGPVDALINALRQACRDQIEFELLDYKVDIRGQGVDAVVYVELKLAKGRIYSVGRGTSPDIIQASMEAFDEAYNSFRLKVI